MADTITEARAFLIEVAAEMERTGDVHSLLKRDMLVVDLCEGDDLYGRDYGHTIGTRGREVLSMLRDHLIDRPIDQQADRIEAVRHRRLASTRSTTMDWIAT